MTEEQHIARFGGFELYYVENMYARLSRTFAVASFAIFWSGFVMSDRVVRLLFLGFVLAAMIVCIGAHLTAPVDGGDVDE
jgi:hypothetical protein